MEGHDHSYMFPWNEISHISPQFLEPRINLGGKRQSII